MVESVFGMEPVYRRILCIWYMRGIVWVLWGSYIVSSFIMHMHAYITKALPTRKHAIFALIYGRYSRIMCGINVILLLNWSLALVRKHLLSAAPSHSHDVCNLHWSIRVYHILCFRYTVEAVEIPSWEFVGRVLCGKQLLRVVLLSYPYQRYKKLMIRCQLPLSLSLSRFIFIFS